MVVMEGRKRRRSKEHEDTAGTGSGNGNGGDSGAAFVEVGNAVEFRSQGLKKRKRSKQVDGDGENDLEIIPLKKKVRSCSDREVGRDGPLGDRAENEVVSLFKLGTSRSESTPVKKKGKTSRRHGKVQNEVNVNSSHLEAETGRNEVSVPHQVELEESKIRKKKGKKSRRDGEVDVPRTNGTLDVDGVSVQLVVKDEVDHSDLESLPVKNKKGRKSRGNREAEIEGAGNKSDSNGYGIGDPAVVQDGVQHYDEQSLPTKKKEGKMSRGNRKVAGDGLLDNSQLDGHGVGDQASVLDGVDSFDVQSLRMKKGKKSRGEREVEVEGFLNGSDSDGHNVEDKSVILNGNNEYGLEAWPVLKKKVKKSRRGKETEYEGHCFTSNSDSDRVQDQVVSLSGVVKSEVGSSPTKKLRKIVRFQPEPEIHWREKGEGEEHEQEDDLASENCEGEGEGNSSVVPHNNISRCVVSEERGWKLDMQRTDLKYGFFSKEEDEKLKTAVYDFIKAKGWGEDEGLDMLLHTKSHSEARGSWLEIAKCLPHRPVKLIHSRADRLLSGLKRGAWSHEDLEKLKELHAQHRHNWKAIEAIMGRPAQLCKDKWRVLRLAPILKKGKWSEEELDRLCMYVRWNLKVKEQLGRKERDRRILRDDINWEIIAEKMGRTSAICSVVWYERLASSLTAQGSWANGDDRRLLRSLMESGASSEEAVDWDELLDDRDGLTCEKRWYQMLRLLSERGAPFEDKLELLVKRYAPDLIGIEEDGDMVTVAQ